jgi:hypothetical protein
MFWFFALITIIAVVVIGLVAVGRVTLTLAEQPRRSNYDLDEAVEYVADNLPYEVSAVLSYDDVRSILGWHIDYLESKGIAYESDDELETTGADSADDQERTPVDERWRPSSGPVLADDDEALAYVLGVAAERGLDVDDVHVAHVLHEERGYLAAIGAIGRAVPTPDDPGAEDGPESGL